MLSQLTIDFRSLISGSFGLDLSGSPRSWWPALCRFTVPRTPCRYLVIFSSGIHWLGLLGESRTRMDISYLKHLAPCFASLMCIWTSGSRESDGWFFRYSASGFVPHSRVVGDFRTFFCSVVGPTPGKDRIPASVGRFRPGKAVRRSILFLFAAWRSCFFLQFELKSDNGTRRLAMSL